MALPPSPRHEKDDRPWWLAVLVLIGIILAVVIITNDIYAQVFRTVVNGAGITVFVTLVAFVLATVLGLGIALKCDDGAHRASEAMVAAVLARLLRADEALAAKLIELANAPIQSRIGAKVGSVRPTAALN